MVARGSYGMKSFEWLAPARRPSHLLEALDSYAVNPRPASRRKAASRS